MIVDIGRVCIKTMGHEADEKCVVVDADKGNFVVIAGPRVKKRRCNIAHLEVLPMTVAVKKGASESEAAEALLKAGLVSKDDLAGKPVGYTPRPAAAKKQSTVGGQPSAPKAESRLPKAVKTEKPKAEKKTVSKK